MRGRKPQVKASSIKPTTEGFPLPPARLPGVARHEWERIGREMGAQLIGALDVVVLEAYCNAVHRVQQINEEIEKLDEITFLTNAGTKMVSFLFSQVAKQEAHMVKLAAELGLTPLARTRLAAEQKAAKEESFEDFVGGGPPQMRMAE